MNCKRFAIPGIIILFMLHGCMYSFKGSLPPHIKSVAIPLFENQTAEYRINETITDILTQQFLEAGILRVTDEKSADSVLEGVVTSINDAPLTYTAGEQVEEYKVTIGLKVTWYDKIQDKDRLDRTFSGWGAYDADQANVTRDDGIEEAISKITDDIINAITANW